MKKDYDMEVEIQGNDEETSKQQQVSVELWTMCVTRRMKEMRKMAKLDECNRTGMSPGRCTLHARTFPHYDRYRRKYALALQPMYLRKQ